MIVTTTKERRLEMTAQTIDSEIQARVEAFTKDLSALVRRSALKTIEDGLGATMRVPRAATKAHARRPASAGAQPSRKREPAALAALVEHLHGYISAHEGQRIEAIGPAMGQPTIALALPIKKLLRAGPIVAHGHKRSTTYSTAAS